MEEVLLRFPQIGENIFEFLDEKSLENGRKVCKSWKNFIESPNQKFRWIKIIKKHEEEITLKKWFSTPCAWSGLRIQNLREFAKCLLFEKINREKKRRDVLGKIHRAKKRTK